jgi:hypothetical protein
VANGVRESISMSVFVEGALSLELHHIYVLLFPISILCLFLSPSLLYICKSPLQGFKPLTLHFLDWGEH